MKIEKLYDKVWIQNAVWIAAREKMGAETRVARLPSTFYIDTPHFTVML